MATKEESKTKTATAKKGKGIPSFTIRQIEARDPCASGYYQALEEAKSNPIPGGPYDNEESMRFNGFTKVKRPRFGPDDPITLLEVVRLGDDDSIAIERVEWLIQELLRDDRGKSFNLTQRLEDEMDRIRREALENVVQQYGVAEKKKPSKKK